MEYRQNDALDYSRWLASLDAPTRQRADGLAAALERAGVAAPERDWTVYSDITENLPQTAKTLLLARLWHEVINSNRSDTAWLLRWIERSVQEPDGQFADGGLAAKRLLDAGGSLEDLASFARGVAYYAMDQTFVWLDNGEYERTPGEQGAAPGWALVETTPEGELTARRMELGEDMLGADPSGRDGRPMVAEG